jgi:hypothetical protein
MSIWLARHPRTAPGEQAPLAAASEWSKSISKTINVQESTLSHNKAQYGARFAVGAATVRNSTLGQQGDYDGGGSRSRTACIWLYNTTIASNRLNRPTGQVYPARGGVFTTTAIITAQNDCDNVRAIITGHPDDCFTSPIGCIHSTT